MATLDPPGCRVERCAAGCGPPGDDFAIPLWLTVLAIVLAFSDPSGELRSSFFLLLGDGGGGCTILRSLFRREDRIYFHGGENGWRSGDLCPGADTSHLLYEA